MTRNELKQDMAEHKIPAYMQDPLLGYILDHHPTGDFLHSVLSNELSKSFFYADDTNRNLLGNYVMFLYDHAPSACWGSPEKVQSWLKERTDVA